MRSNENGADVAFARGRQLIWLVSICVVATGVSAPAAADGPSAGGIEEIVVRARKRAERLIDTPVSVTALGAEQLERSGVQRLDDLEGFVPNLQFNLGPDSQAANIFIRGIGTSTPGVVSFDPGVGIYVDGVFLPRAQSQLLDTVDIAQVEVLRGPQGTLFGKNTVGGAISITTAKPHEEIALTASIRPGNQDSVATRMMLNLPLIPGRVLSRVAFASTTLGGYVDNTVQDQTHGDRNALSFVGSLRFLLAEGLTFDVAGTWSRDHNNGRGAQCVFVQETGLQALVPGLADACRRSRRYDVGTNERTLSDLESWGTWGTLTWEAGRIGPLDDVTLLSISSWREQRQAARLDFDATEVFAIKTSDFGGSPTDGTPTEQRQVSQELQLSASALEDRFHFVTGAFAYWEQATDPQTLSLGGAVALVNENIRISDSWNWALFGQATLDVTDWLSVTGGIRYTEEKKGLDAINRDPLADDPGQRLSAEAIFTAWTPMASVSLRAPEDWLDPTPLEHLLVYFTWSRGFRGGGFDGTLNPNIAELQPFAPEHLDSFEWGVKTVAFDGRVGLNVSVFFTDYEDIQVTTIQEDPFAQAGFVQRILNGAEASTHGAEVEWTWRPAEGLSLGGGIGVLITEFDQFTAVSNLDGSVIERAGERFNAVPEFQAQAVVQYDLPVELGGKPDRPWLDGVLSPRLEWQYRSSVYLLGPEIPAAKQRGYNNLNARLGYRFAEGRWEVALWVRNLTAEEHFSAVLPAVSSYGTVNRYFDNRRTFGAEIRFRL